MKNIKRDLQSWGSLDSSIEIDYLREMLDSGWSLVSVFIGSTHHVYYWSK